MSKKRRNRRNRNSSQNFKSKRITRTIGIIAAVILGCTILTSTVGFMSDGFMDSNPLNWVSKELNENNLIKVDDYLIKDDDDLDAGKGITGTVNDDGVIKLTGKADAENIYTVVELTLQPGTYTISGVDSSSKYGIQVVYGSQVAKSGTNSETFSITEAQTVAVQIYVAEDTVLFYKSFKPCLVPGDEAEGLYE